MTRRWLAPLGVALGLVAACGGGTDRPPSSVSDPRVESTPSADMDQAPTAASTAVPPNPPPPSTAAAQPTSDDPGVHPGTRPVAPVPPPTNSGGAPDARRSWALATLGDGERQIEATVKECSTACRALASMERAAKTLCDLGDRDECSRAKARVDAARDKVKKSCGACASP